MSLFLSLVSSLYTIVFASTVMCLAGRFATPPITHTSRSFCDHCKRQLTWWQLIPILGWLWQRGRCHFCQATISCRYVAYEVSFGLLTACFISHTSLATTYSTIAFLLILLALAEIDRAISLVPTFLNIILLVTALIIRQPPISECLILFTVYVLGQYLLHRYPVLGNADLDIIVIFVVAWGWLAMTQIVLISCVLALLRQRHVQPTRQPFIPDLCHGCLMFCFLTALALL